MTILFITAFPPNQKTAGQDYTRRLLNDLTEKGHSVSLIYADYPGHSIELDNRVNVISVIHPDFRNCLFHLRLHPFYTRRFNSKTLECIKSRSAHFDLLYFDFSQIHVYSLFVNHPNKVLMCHDVICQKFSRKGKVQLPWIKRCEKKLLSTANKIVTFSKKDSNVIKCEYGLDSVPVNFYLKNGQFDYCSSKITIYENTFCFYGAWNRAENTECLEWFFSEVYPNVRGNIEYVVIGGGMSKSLKNWLCAYKNVKCLGFVDNPVVEIAKCQALIAPLHKGAGVKVKVIDALSCGCSVIGTDIAFEGIEDNSENKLFYVADLPGEYADLLNQWKTVSAENKQAVADEFFLRYNKNHFTDLIESKKKADSLS
ncbi:glycosyltransferase [Treponema brennaborense]|uniref:Glycosyltransferase subfamily 4-like N-terminal domain-containing protein n=1 Tax=Treponema brennaborense (strain DSM 12168 / CIP 105900 / DD5/3) TaxID=906968 RepID=F4LIY9_TREBD|nr:glycosyltransferase [Treponema brennaborense]AEE17298.1 hypothetical protein Trebr_1879 [Treponema brennaborense DSM 12168]